jgi:hypothetical protein
MERCLEGLTGKPLVQREKAQVVLRHSVLDQPATVTDGWGEETTVLRSIDGMVGGNNGRRNGLLSGDALLQSRRRHASDDRRTHKGPVELSDDNKRPENAVRPGDLSGNGGAHPPGQTLHPPALLASPRSLRERRLMRG